MINFLYGDLLKCNDDYIVHQVNCKGIMGSGIAKQVKEQFPNVYLEYINYINRHFNEEELLGEILVVPIDKKRSIINLFSQKNFGYDGKRYTDYDAIRKGLSKINTYYKGKTIAIPFLMGCCRGGGDWNIVDNIIRETLIDCDVNIYCYNGG